MKAAQEPFGEMAGEAAAKDRKEAVLIRLDDHFCSRVYFLGINACGNSSSYKHVDLAVLRRRRAWPSLQQVASTNSS